MKSKRIYLYLENTKQPDFSDITEDQIVSELLNKYVLNKFPGINLDQFLFFKEDSQDNIDIPTSKYSDLEDKGRYSLHRCKKIKVKVTYNGRQIEKFFTPSTTGKSIFKWSLKEFHFPDDEDVSKFELRVNSAEGELLEKRTHIGSIVSHPNCEILFYLVPKKNVQGESGL